MDTGILAETGKPTDITRHQVAKAGGSSIDELIASRDKGRCIGTMLKGASVLTKGLYAEGKFQGVISIGGAQGTDIGTAAMRELPFGVPKFMVSTVASGRATFGPFVGTKDITMMHSVADIQGINFITRRVLDNAAAAICGMVKNAAVSGYRTFRPRSRGPLDARHRHPGGAAGDEAPLREGLRRHRVPSERDGRDRHGGHDPRGDLQGGARPQPPRTGGFGGERAPRLDPGLPARIRRGARHSAGRRAGEHQLCGAGDPSKRCRRRC